MIYRPVLPGDFVQAPPLKRLLPGGYIQSPLRQVLPGGLIQVNADSDPLAGIDLVARFQTHDGDNVPVRMWQDVAMTIPAVNAFDSVAARLSYDELLLITQPDPNLRPLLVFNGDAPVLEYDGVDDWIGGDLAVNPTQSMMFAVAQTTTTSVEQHFFTIANIGNQDAQSCCIQDGFVEPHLFRSTIGSFPFVASSVGDVTDWNQWTGSFNGTSATIRINDTDTSGAVENIISTGLITVGALRWGPGTHQMFSGFEGACFLTTSILSNTDRDRVIAYQRSLFPLLIP